MPLMAWIGSLYQPMALRQREHLYQQPQNPEMYSLYLMPPKRNFICLMAFNGLRWAARHLPMVVLPRINCKLPVLLL